MVAGQREAEGPHRLVLQVVEVEVQPPEDQPPEDPQPEEAVASSEGQPVGVPPVEAPCKGHPAQPSEEQQAPPCKEQLEGQLEGHLEGQPALEDPRRQVDHNKQHPLEVAQVEDQEA